jgi:Protein of unknown function (DUF2853)
MAATTIDYNALTAKYTSKVNADAVAAIVKYCGVALKSKDSRYVAVSDKAETGRIIKGYCSKKLGLEAETASAAVAAAALKMKADRMKHRVPFYYLIAEHAGKFDMLTGEAPEAMSPKAATVSAPTSVAPAAVRAAPVAKAPVVTRHAAATVEAPSSGLRWYMKGSRYDTLTS